VIPVELITYLPSSTGKSKRMNNTETLIVLAAYFTGVLLIAAPFIIDTIKQDRKLNKGAK
jgi:VIT1/CCC1 family predicted Fe2+/Mn2+ transporter